MLFRSHSMEWIEASSFTGGIGSGCGCVGRVGGGEDGCGFGLGPSSKWIVGDAVLVFGGSGCNSPKVGPEFVGYFDEQQSLPIF